MTIELVDVDGNFENNPTPPEKIEEPQESQPARPSTPEPQEEEQTEPDKKGRGWPKGSPNKPKAEPKPKPEPKPKRKTRLPEPESESDDEPLEPPPRQDKIPKPKGIDAVPVDHLLKERMQTIHARAQDERTQRQNQYMQMLSEKLR